MTERIINQSIASLSEKILREATNFEEVLDASYSISRKALVERDEYLMKEEYQKAQRVHHLLARLFAHSGHNARFEIRTSVLGRPQSLHFFGGFQLTFSSSLQQY